MLCSWSRLPALSLCYLLRKPSADVCDFRIHGTLCIFIFHTGLTHINDVVGCFRVFSGFNVENVVVLNEVDPSRLSREEDWDLP